MVSTWLPGPQESAHTLPRILCPAVSAAPVHLAHILRVKVLHCDGSCAIVLQHLVLRVPRAATVDVRGARLLFKGCGILADVGPPDIVERAGP